MSKFNTGKIMPRYLIIAVALTMVGLAIVGKALYLMTAKKDYWTEVAGRLKHDSIPMSPGRGNILSCDGQLMATSIPEYRIYIDFQPGKMRGVDMDTIKARKLDSLWTEKMDSVCMGLHKIFPQRSAEQFKERIQQGRYKKLADGSVGARHWAVWPKRIDYTTYRELLTLPMFNLPTNKGGFIGEELISRRRPFGSLAQRTVGNIGSEKKRTPTGRIYTKDSARFGLELSCDSILRGTMGVKRTQKVLNRQLNLVVKPAEAGADIVTTIDVNMQDLCERSVIDELKLIGGNKGVAILMEVSTGEVKAIVNINKCSDGEYREMYNDAISFRCEPGSVFKVASFLVALDDGVIDTTMVIPTGSGVMEMHKRLMKDHNWRKGGYGSINAARALEVSSNIGVSYLIDKYYRNNPENFVKGLRRVGISEDLQLQINGYLAPVVRMPKRNSRGQFTNWSLTDLPWMSIGYVTQIAPINTLTFYNAIANDGKMVRPRFVKKIIKEGQTIKEFEPEVVKERIAKPSTIKTMQTVLEHVVSQGLGRKAGSKMFRVAGKTGTAQMSKGAAGYKSGIVDYWLSFAGYFPADKPRYSCIVCLEKSGLPASGGGMSGVVFHNIAEGVMSKHLKRHINDAKDTTSIKLPDVKNGDVGAAGYVLSQLGVQTDASWDGSFASGQPVWGTAARQDRKVQLTKTQPRADIVPDVTGMGARDAVYMMESRGVKVHVSGRGKVKAQSLAAGKPVKRGMVCELRLEI